MNRRERRAARKSDSASIGAGAIARATHPVKAPGASLPSLDVALAHLQAGRHLDAQLGCQQALAMDPNHADALHLMGQISLHAKQHDHAVEWIARAIRQSPKPEYLATLGTALQQQGRHDDALKAFDKAVQLRPEDADLWINLGNALFDQKRPSEALLTYQRALTLSPRHLEAACRCAFLLHQLGRLEEALVHFNLCDELRPHHVPTLVARSLVLRDLKRFEEYLVDSQRAYRLNPTSAEMSNGIGDALLLLGRFEESLEWFDRMLKFQPSSILALENKAVALRRMHRFDELFSTYNYIRSIDPTNTKIELRLAHDNLLLGNFEAGWRGREARWRVPDLPIAFPAGPEPIWLGEESIEEKTILVYSDEGLGDAIQFVRYAPMLAARGARVVLVVQEALCSLLSTLPGVSHCLSTSVATLPPADFRCAMMSLPLAFRTTFDTIPLPVRLSPPVDRLRAWEDRLGPHDKLRVGLTWSGSLTHPNDHNRSISLQLLTDILDVDATFVSLQRDPRPDDKAVLLERADIVDLTMHVTDFGEAAALVACLDLVITVDTSMAHLAGTLGRPTWILLPYTPDYRWLLDRDDSPWYPTVRLFRQSDRRDYAEVIARVRAELKTQIAAWADGRKGEAR